MHSNEPRIRGLQYPFSAEQIIAGTGEIIFTTLAYIIFSLYARDEYKIMTIIVYSIPVILVLIMYIYCSYIDPSLPGGIPCICMKTTQNTTRYCRICKKSIPGLDHHCTWLNTCIGKHNYWAFYILATGGIIQYLLHVIFCILTVTVWYEEDKRTVGMIIFTSIVALMGCSGILSFGSLWLFHTHLLWEGIGTYDWLLRRAERTRIQQETEARALREKTLAETHKTLLGTTTSKSNMIPNTDVPPITPLTTDIPYPTSISTSKNIIPNYDNYDNGAEPISSPSLRASRVAEMQQQQQLNPSDSSTTNIIQNSSPTFPIEHETISDTNNKGNNMNNTDEAYIEDIVYIREHIDENVTTEHRSQRKNLFSAKSMASDDNDNNEYTDNIEEGNKMNNDSNNSNHSITVTILTDVKEGEPSIHEIVSESSSSAEAMPEEVEAATKKEAPQTIVTIAPTESNERNDILVNEEKTSEESIDTQ